MALSLPMGSSPSQRISRASSLFEGRREVALEFYREAFGAEVTMLMRYKESPQPVPCETPPAGSEDKIMRASFSIGDTMVMASDGMCSGKPGFQGFSLSLTVASEKDADRLFDALADGGEGRMPLEETFWSSGFGMVTDRFGVSWMINTEAEAQ